MKFCMLFFNLVTFLKTVKSHLLIPALKKKQPPKILAQDIQLGQKTVHTVNIWQNYIQKIGT